MKFGFVFVPNRLLAEIAGCARGGVPEFLCRGFKLGVYRFRNLVKND